MFDDDAPITGADIAQARRFLRLLRALAMVACVGGVMASGLAVIVVDDWMEQQADRRLCSERARDTIAALEQAPPTPAVLHRGEGGVIVVDTPTLAALMVDGRVVGSTLRCPVGYRYPARAWTRELGNGHEPAGARK
jgi:hypothetical protein